MKKLYLVLGVLFVLPMVAVPAAASGNASVKALCDFFKGRQVQASTGALSTCGGVGVELVASASAGSQSSQTQLDAEAERLRAIADEKYAAYTAAIHARQAAYQAKDAYAIEHNCADGYHNMGMPACSDSPEYQALVQAYDDAQQAEWATSDEYYEADDIADEAAYRADVAAGRPVDDSLSCRYDGINCPEVITK